MDLLIAQRRHDVVGAVAVRDEPHEPLDAIPPATEREHELELLLEAYGSDAVAELGASWLGFRSDDPERVLASGIATLDEIDDVARRMVALRNWGVADGAKRLGISHGALSRWARRRKIPT